MRKKQQRMRGGPAKEHRKKEVKEVFDAFKPSIALLSKLGSLIVHADEFMSVGGHTVDRETFRNLLANPDVQQWMKAMGPLLPLKREAR